MGNGTSNIICVTPDIGCGGLAGAPFLLLGATLLFLIWVPLFIHCIWGTSNRKNVVSISETWREPMMPTLASVIMVPMLMVYCICLNGWQILLLLWIGAVFLLFVVAINPGETPSGADEKTVKRMGELRTTHGVFAFLLFTFMLCVALWLVSTTFQGTASFYAALVFVVLLCIFYLALIALALAGWPPTASLVEIVFATLFLFLVTLISEVGTTAPGKC